ncbi:hypothetical protein [Pleurocapsa sp. PCC 7319]|uniref:hypothetical protein n=1 Tax=Pleurocapsa sp. PCC 7319 TaxID=118161 RepID=UPI000345EAF5|nr:hypothetical protein [Pleurocapsa sp. PCC 7319]
MINTFSFSLEQDFALRVLSDQIKKITDVVKLQDDLIELFKQSLLRQQEMRDYLYFQAIGVVEVSITHQKLSSELEARLSSYISLIRLNTNIEDLQELLIQANQMLMIHEYYLEVLWENMLESPFLD